MKASPVFFVLALYPFLSLPAQSCPEVSLATVRSPARAFALSSGVIQPHDEYNDGQGTRLRYEAVKLVRHRGNVLIGFRGVYYSPAGQRTIRSVGPEMDVIVLKACRGKRYRFARFEDAYPEPTQVIARLSWKRYPNLGKFYVRFRGKDGYPVLKSIYAKLQNPTAFTGIVLKLNEGEQLPAYDPTPNRRWKVVDTALILHASLTPEGSNIYPLSFDEDVDGTIAAAPEARSQQDGDGKGATGASIWPIGFTIEAMRVE